MSERVVSAFIDRFEGNTAVLFLGEELHEVHLPKSVLPDEAREGSSLRVHIEMDETVASDAKQRIARLIRKLD